MFVDEFRQWQPPPEEPEPRRPPLGRREGRVLAWLIGINLAALFFAPIGGMTLVQLIVACFRR